MIGAGLIRRLRARLRDESGASIVELAVVLPLFLLILFALLDFGRFAFQYVLAQKGMQDAVRIAVVRAPVCGRDGSDNPPLPLINMRADPDGNEPLGQKCSEDDVCVAPDDVVCSLAAPEGAGQATADEIWEEHIAPLMPLAPLMPPGTTRDNIRITYSFDPALGFLGGPYRPMVRAEIVDLEFEFVTPLSAIGNLAARANDGSDLGGTAGFFSMEASMPAEDLANGDDL